MFLHLRLVLDVALLVKSVLSIKSQTTDGSTVCVTVYSLVFPIDESCNRYSNRHCGRIRGGPKGNIARRSQNLPPY